MSHPPLHILRLMALAAEARAGGFSWESTAAKIHRSSRTCRRWLDAYPQAWHRLLRTAERRLLREAGSESLMVLRKLLRSKDERSQRDAGKFLLRLGVDTCDGDERELNDGRDSEPCTAHLSTLSDEELQALIDEETKRVAQHPEDPNQHHGHDLAGHG